MGAPTERGGALAVVYFGVAFTLSATLVMLGLMLARPALGDLSTGARQVAMLAPVLVGLPYGLRVAWIGRREGLRLGAALRRGLGFGAK